MGGVASMSNVAIRNGGDFESFVAFESAPKAASGPAKRQTAKMKVGGNMDPHSN